jgi:hypothetical protein
MERESESVKVRDGEIGRHTWDIKCFCESVGGRESNT